MGDERTPPEPSGRPDPDGRDRRDPEWAWPPPPQPAVKPAGVVNAASGSPYHRMARTARHRWWLPPLAVLAGAVAWLLVQLLIGIIAGVGALLANAPLDETLFGGTLVELAIGLLSLAALIPIAMAVARVVQRRGPGTLSSVEGGLRWRWLAVCLLLALVSVVGAVGVPLLLYVLADPDTAVIGAFVGVREFAVTMAVLAILVPLQAAGEEYGIRGFLMQAVGAYTRSPLLPILVSAAVFTLLHFYSAWAMAEVAIFGVAMAWLIWRTGGLEAAIALHVLHNLSAFGFQAWEGRLERETSGSWQSLLGTLVEVAVFTALVLWLARRRGVVRVSTAAVATAGASAWTGPPESEGERSTPDRHPPPPGTGRPPYPFGPPPS